MVTIIGIGTEKGDLTLRGAQKIEESKAVFLRSAKTAAGRAVKKQYAHAVALDDCFVSSDDFGALISAICARVTEAEREHGSAVYLTDGDGYDDVACALAACTETKIVCGPAPHGARGYDACSLRLSASDALVRKPYIDTALPLHITEIDDKYLAGELKLWLMGYYDDETPVTVCRRGERRTVPLCETDRLPAYDETCELYVAAVTGYEKKKYGFGDLMRIMARLTAPDGCPWDGAQTHESIRINMIEEAYEAVDAIDAGDTEAMEEELGDVLLQAVFHCDMAQRFGEFTLSDALSTLCRKLVHRHTHIFGENKAKDAGEALGFWEQAKSVEKSYVSVADKLNRLPDGFPSLLAAEKVYKKLRKAGVRWKSEPVGEEEGVRQLFALTAALADGNVDAEVALHAFITDLKKKFAAAEEAGDTEGFLQSL